MKTRYADGFDHSWEAKMAGAPRGTGTSGGKPYSKHAEAIAGENPFIEIVKNRQFQRRISQLPVNEICHSKKKYPKKAERECYLPHV